MYTMHLMILLVVLISYSQSCKLYDDDRNCTGYDEIVIIDILFADNIVTHNCGNFGCYTHESTTGITLELDTVTVTISTTCPASHIKLTDVGKTEDLLVLTAVFDTDCLTVQEVKLLETCMVYITVSCGAYSHQTIKTRLMEYSQDTDCNITYTVARADMCIMYPTYNTLDMATIDVGYDRYTESLNNTDTITDTIVDGGDKNTIIGSTDTSTSCSKEYNTRGYASSDQTCPARKHTDTNYISIILVIVLVIIIIIATAVAVFMACRSEQPSTIELDVITEAAVSGAYLFL